MCKMDRISKCNGTSDVELVETIRRVAALGGNATITVQKVG